jgi:hypothetical protein
MEGEKISEVVNGRRADTKRKRTYNHRLFVPLSGFVLEVFSTAVHQR